MKIGQQVISDKTWKKLSKSQKDEITYYTEVFEEKIGTDKDHFTQISKDDERIDQYSTKTRAIRDCKLKELQTGLPHKYIFTKCYRNGGLSERTCWSTYLK